MKKLLALLLITACFACEQKKQQTTKERLKETFSLNGKKQVFTQQNMEGILNYP